MFHDIKKISRDVFQLALLLSLCRIQQPSRKHTQNITDLYQTTQLVSHADFHHVSNHTVVFYNSISPDNTSSEPDYQLPHSSNHQDSSQLELSQQDLDVVQLLWQEDVNLAEPQDSEGSEPPLFTDDSPSSLCDENFCDYSLNEALAIGLDTSDITYLQDDTDKLEWESQLSPTEVLAAAHVNQHEDIDDELETLEALIQVSQSIDSSLLQGVGGSPEDLNNLLDTSVHLTEEPSSSSIPPQPTQFSTLGDIMETMSTEFLEGAIGGEPSPSTSENTEGTAKDEYETEESSSPFYNLPSFGKQWEPCKTEPTAIFCDDITPPPNSAGFEEYEAVYMSKTPCMLDHVRGETLPPTDRHVRHNHSYALPPGHTEECTEDRKVKIEPEEYRSQDDKLVRNLGIDLTTEQIINLPIDKFNEKLTLLELTDHQLAFIRDVRKRGKNKVAAQNCRKRRLHKMLNLADELQTIQSKRAKYFAENKMLHKKKVMLEDKLSKLYTHVMEALTESDEYSDEQFYPFQDMHQFLHLTSNTTHAPT